MKRLVISSGEPAGIGPEQVVMLSQQDWDFEWIALGNRDLFKTRAKDLGLEINISDFDPKAEKTANKKGQLKVQHFKLEKPVKAGELAVENAAYVLNMLHYAIDECMNSTFDGLVTGPIHKGIINEAGLKFTGHTELLAERSNTDTVVMMLATPGLRVPLATTHLPLREIADAIKPDLLEKIIRITHHALASQFAIKNPAIYIAGLNPHAGEDGHLGLEEIEVMNPVINRLKEEGMNLIGPLPADTMFTPPNIAKSDAMLAMYHDQGLPVLKHVGFGSAVNVTLGLPFVRTSVDHGTALDIAGTGKASASSFEYAMQVAIEMTAGQDK